MSSRDAILARLRRSLGVSGQEAGRRAVVTERLAAAPRGIIPARAQVEGEARIALFIAQAEAVSATVERVPVYEDVPRAIAEHLRGANLPARLRIGADARLAALPFSETGLEVTTGPSDGSDAAALSHAVRGIAETGTLVLTSGSDNPTTLNFLPDRHFVVIRAEDIGPDMETAWDKLRETTGKGEMPRTVNLITGPSRSADIEQTLILGAHGPRQLHILVVG